MMHGQQNIKLKQTINMETIRLVPTFDNHLTSYGRGGQRKECT
jgi:hypothetical protein